MRGSRHSLLPLAERDFRVCIRLDAHGCDENCLGGSGLRVTVPKGAANQPLRVIIRAVKAGVRHLTHGGGDTFPPPLPETGALASRIFEVGPPGTAFNAPIQLELPHFAWEDSEEREYTVLRSDQGGPWTEHGDFEVLSNRRIVKVSTVVIPSYLAILYRAKRMSVSNDGLMRAGDNL